MNAKLIKIDRNGSKHFVGDRVCDRCGGSGVYVHHMENGKPSLHWNYGGVCLKCDGAGVVTGKWIERTPEYQAKLDAKRAAKNAAQEAEAARLNAEREAREAEEAEREAKRKAEVLARKAISQYVGTVGERLELHLWFQKAVSFEVPAFRGFGTETKTISTLVDDHGNVFVWKSSCSIGMDTDKGWKSPAPGDPVVIKATIKDHSVYQDQKQTVLTRCKVIRFYH